MKLRYEGLKANVNSMIETVQFLFHNRICYKLAEFFCLNPLENYLDWKRSLVGCKENHAMREFGFNNNVSNCTDGRYDFSDKIFHIVKNFKLSTNVCYFVFQSYMDKYCCLMGWLAKISKVNKRGGWNKRWG